ncbi:hypothetical protein PRUB_a2161 [Pseudoalteromonas rubra]|uniref:Lipoprotein n=1 Tax=Pseudoalteromonas rubra TaxID=43658 RepID=A0A8T0CE51_9GAMM|nr:hypothetical protein [Pseudoalteromonas rubra]KAF7789027.1 hypothetical protein PRUB_a2161 [Pseudoalteromonas rubra]
MKSLTNLSLVCLTLAAAGCSAVSYQSMGIRGGYSEKQLNEHTYRVHYSGNGSVSLEQAIDFALLRSAVIAQQHGSDTFISSNYSANVSSTYAGTPGVYVSKPSVYLDIALNNEQAPNNTAACGDFANLFQLMAMQETPRPFSHDTQACIEQVQHKYQLTEQQVFDKK